MSRNLDRMIAQCEQLAEIECKAPTLQDMLEGLHAAIVESFAAPMAALPQRFRGVGGAGKDDYVLELGQIIRMENACCRYAERAAEAMRDTVDEQTVRAMLLARGMNHATAQECLDRASTALATERLERIAAYTRRAQEGIEEVTAINRERARIRGVSKGLDRLLAKIGG